MNIERRKTPRTKVEALAYINFEPNNGGIVLNVSEEGLCFHAVTPVQQDGGTLQFWFSAEGQRVEASGELAWTDESRKTGGLRFAVLPAEVHHQIRSWIEQCAMLPAAEQAPRFLTGTHRSVPLNALSPDVAPDSGEQFAEDRADANALAELEPDVAHALAKPATEIKAATTPDRPARSKALQARVMRNITPAWRPTTNFVRGVATGLSISALLALAFSFHSYRRQLGESLISLGERFGANPSKEIVAAAAAPQPNNTPSAVAPVVPGRIDKHPAAPGDDAAASDEEISSALPIDSVSTTGSLPTSANSPTSGTSPMTGPIAGAATALDSDPVSGEANEAKKPAETGLATNPAGGDAPAVEIKSTGDVTGLTGRAADSDDSRVPDFKSAPGKYLEVGAFRRKGSADAATKTVNELGIHTAVIHQGLFWLNSYHVLAGPYTSQNEAVAARSRLESSGFKARTLPSRSRGFKLPLMTIYGTDVSVTDCTITWDLYSPEATVTFMRGNTVVARARAKWEKRNVTYKTNAVLHRSNERGLKTLLEIQCHGMDQALVFGDSEAVRYFTPPPDVGL